MRSQTNNSALIFTINFLLLALAMLVGPLPETEAQETNSKPSNLEYVEAKAYYILPETHNNQSGYFSLSEGHDGNVHIGTTKYGDNAFLVEFDPRTESQRIVLDTNQVCGLDAKGYAAQAKLHTRNFVGPSGKVYVGSKQGYRLNADDTADYPGGYAMSYDPRNGRTENLGMPFPGQGIADIAVDESRNQAYVVTCENQHWMLGDLKLGTWKELGPILTPYAMTLIAADGKAYALTEKFELAVFDPNSGEIEIRPVQVNGKKWHRATQYSIPTWVLSADKKRAWLILLNDPTLLEIDLVGDGPARVHGKLIEGEHPDNRCGLDLGADGNVYAVVRIDNTTGFGKGYLHHLVRYLPKTKTVEDLGVLAVSNPDYFDWDEGFRRQAAAMDSRFPSSSRRYLDATSCAYVFESSTRQHNLYHTVIYPFTLLKVDEYRIPENDGPAEKVIHQIEDATHKIEMRISSFTAVAQAMAERHIKGGLIGFPFFSQPIAQELWGRSGGVMHIGFNRGWKEKEKRTPAEKANDMAIVAYEGKPGEQDLEQLKQLKDRGVYIVGFGPKHLTTLQEIVKLCDVWFDADLNKDQSETASTDWMTVNALQSTTLIAEFIGALTRHGKMPVIWKGYAYEDGRAWGEKYFRKKQFHDDYEVEKLKPGELGFRYLTQIRYPLRQLTRQGDDLRLAAAMLHKERSKSQVFVAWQGHMPMTYVGKSEADRWAKPIEFHPFLPSQVAAYEKAVPENALVLSLGYHGLDPIQAATWKQKNNRVIHLAGDHPDPTWAPESSVHQSLDLGFAFGDACVSLQGYPLCLFAPSGIAQRAAYLAILEEMNTLQMDLPD